MKPLIGLVVLFFATSAFAQTAPPKAAKRPPAQVRPQAPWVWFANWSARSEAPRSGRVTALLRRQRRKLHSQQHPRPRALAVSSPPLAVFAGDVNHAQGRCNARQARP